MTFGGTDKVSGKDLVMMVVVVTCDTFTSFIVFFVSSVELPLHLSKRNLYGLTMGDRAAIGLSLINI